MVVSVRLIDFKPSQGCAKATPPSKTAARNRMPCGAGLRPAFFRSIRNIISMLQRPIDMRDLSHRLSASSADLHLLLRHVRRAQRELHLASLTSQQMNTLETPQVADGIVGAARSAHIQLNYFIALAR